MLIPLYSPLLLLPSFPSVLLAPSQRRLLADAEERVVELVELVFRSFKALSESAPSGMMPPVAVPGLTNQHSSNYTLAPSPTLQPPVAAAAAAAGHTHLSPGTDASLPRERERGNGQEEERGDEEENKENECSKHGGRSVGGSGEEGNKGRADENTDDGVVPQGRDSDSPAAPALAPAVALFTLLFDCEREEVQEALREHLRVSGGGGGGR